MLLCHYVTVVLCYNVSMLQLFFFDRMNIHTVALHFFFFPYKHFWQRNVNILWDLGAPIWIEDIFPQAEKLQGSKGLLSMTVVGKLMKSVNFVNPWSVNEFVNFVKS